VLRRASERVESDLVEGGRSVDVEALSGRRGERRVVAFLDAALG
jgi:hypothetical protein